MTPYFKEQLGCEGSMSQHDTPEAVPPLVRLSDVIAALTSPAARPEQAGPDHKFKNFHRLLCERFGYTHDERDWMRDQISLIEHIAKKLPAQALTDERATDFDLICQAIDKADTITMEVDYMMDSGDCIQVVRVMQALLDIMRPARAALAQQAAQAPCGTVTAYEDSTGQHYQFTPSWGWVGTRRFDVFEAPPAQAQQPSTHWTEREPVRLAASRVGRVYLAGPMTGYAEFNFPAFNAEAAMLRGQGLSVLNPAEHGIVDGAEWADYLRHDIAGLASCERIHLLRGWSKSKGAALEVTIAKALGMAITYQAGAEQAQQAAVVPEGWKLVPVEPTREMLSAALEECGGIGGGSCGEHTGVDSGDFSWVWSTMLAAAPTAAAQVPDVQREIADALALFPVDLESKTFRVNVYNQSQVIEADGDTQFFSKKKVMALLEKLHGHLTAAATPTPPAQAAADARDAERYRMVRRGQHWSVITGIGDTLRGEDLDAAIDAVSVGQR